MDTQIEKCDLAALSLRLRRRARRLGSPSSEAEDLAQETVLRLMQHMKRLDVKAPEHYAMTILQNLARAQWRTQTETVPLEEDDLSTPPVAESRLALAELQRAIADLPPEQAQVMQQVLIGENSPSAIAAHLDLPIGTVMSRLARARAKLRVQIGLGTDAPVAELL
jgi:RNA polymerase sigma-70 factor (ECF subfamily)